MQVLECAKGRDAPSGGILDVITRITRQPYLLREMRSKSKNLSTLDFFLKKRNILAVPLLLQRPRARTFRGQSRRTLCELGGCGASGGDGRGAREGTVSVRFIPSSHLSSPWPLLPHEAKASGTDQPVSKCARAFAELMEPS